MNEEEVKTKIVLPYLQRLGLQASDLSFESTFSLQIGTNKVLVNGRKPKRAIIGGRLDTLIRRRGTNLLILELKESSHTLTDDDRDQAVSYARLVHPIAPYSILTNGVDWQLFDTISKSQLKPEEIKIKDSYWLVLPDADRDNALSFFLGYSEENLLSFCQAQVKEQLKPLTGSPQDLTKKYIPELTTPRAAFLGELASFENAPANGFLLLAESGFGKTSALCDYALRRLAEGKPTLFFSGPTLENGLLPAITGEFGWVFSEELTAIMLIRRLSELAKDAPVIIVIDAIDEWPYAQRAPSLVNLLRSSRDYRVKFVFSCRTAAWEGISQPFGSDIGFSSYLFCPTDEAKPKEAYQLGRLSDPEFYQAVSNYRNVFKVHGAFEDKALDEARVNPFMLRVMFAVAAELGQKHLTFSSREFFEKYLDLLLRKCGRRDLARAQILAIAKLMFDRNEEAVSDTEVRSSLSFSANEALLPALFEQNILQHRGAGYAFYFQHLRSYLIAFKLCDWPSAQPAALATIKRSGVQRDALAFYLRYATSEQIQSVTDPIWKHAHEYLELYTKLVARHVPQLDHELVPGEGSELGFIAEYIVQRHVLGGYGFRRHKAGESPVLLIPVDGFFSNSNLLGMTGANSLHHFGSSNGFLKLDVRKEVIEHELIEGVKRTIERRRLSLRGCEKLGAEALVSAIWQDQRTFGAFFDSYNRTLQFPISVKAAQEAIQRAKLSNHFVHELIEGKQRKGTLKERWSPGGFVSYSHDFSKEEQQEINTAIDQALATGKFPALRAVTTNLRDMEAALNRTGVFETLTTIERSPWHTGYGLSLEIGRDHAAGVSLVREHIRNLYEEYLRTYQTVIDINFPTMNPPRPKGRGIPERGFAPMLAGGIHPRGKPRRILPSGLKEVFPLRAKMPLRLFLDVEPGVPESRQEVAGRLVIAYERLPAGVDNEVVMCSPGDLVIDTRQGVSFRGRSIVNACRILFQLDRRMYSMGAPLLLNMIYARITQEWGIVANYCQGPVETGQSWPLPSGHPISINSHSIFKKLPAIR